MNVKNYNICDITLDTAIQQFQNSGDSFPEATIIAASQLGPLLREAGNNLKKFWDQGIRHSCSETSLFHDAYGLLAPLIASRPTQTGNKRLNAALK